jgi:5-(aminomethyl)-3-furanmethanol phosphate kinase
MTVVVKLGGSLANAGTLRSWLRAVRENGAGRCVIVPGGGVFADAVRAAQQRFTFSDAAAHVMALLAMEQYAALLADLDPALQPCTTTGEIGSALARGGVALWRPHAMVASEPGIAASWDVASDSLAAWLAGRIGARLLVLVKSAPRLPPPLSAKRLAETGLVDAAFPGHVAAAACALEYCGPGDEPRLAEALRLG